jgi:hypothetical protein
MNIDLITKLAKLANNNPNENEANLAARKVCRLLAEGDFKFNGAKTRDSFSDPLDDLLRSVRKARQGSPYQYGDWVKPPTDYEETFRKAQREQQQKADAERYNSRKKQYAPPQEPTFYPRCVHCGTRFTMPPMDYWKTDRYLCPECIRRGKK